ncbi:4261_t:CDS:1, partial [Racocetra fulgida]
PRKKRIMEEGQKTYKKRKLSTSPNRNYTSDDDTSVSEVSDVSSTDDDKSFYEKYLVLKAKHRYIRRENELLLDEYQSTKKKLKRLRTEKDILLDAVVAQDGD